MRREVIFRITRILLVILFLLLATSLRTVTKESYSDIDSIRKSIGTNLQVMALTNGVNKPSSLPTSDEEGAIEEGYKFKVTNYSNLNKDFKMVLVNTIKDENKMLPYSSLRYQIICNDEVIVTDNIPDNGVLYKGNINGKENKVYEVKFSIDEDAGSEIYGKQFSSQIALL